MWVIALIKSVKDLHPKMASKDGRACKLQRRLKTGGWVKGKFSHGEITWHIFLESWLRVFVLVNICDVVSKLNSVEIAICYLPRFLPKRQVQRRMSQQQRRATVAELCRPEGLKQLEAKTCPKLEGFWKMRKHPNAFERILLDDQELISDTEIH